MTDPMRWTSCSTLFLDPSESSKRRPAIPPLRVRRSSSCYTFVLPQRGIDVCGRAGRDGSFRSSNEMGSRSHPTDSQRALQSRSFSRWDRRACTSSPVGCGKPCFTPRRRSEHFLRVLPLILCVLRYAQTRPQWLDRQHHARRALGRVR